MFDQTSRNSIKTLDTKTITTLNQDDSKKALALAHLRALAFLAGG